MRHAFSILGAALGGAIFGTVLWFMVNGFIQINNKGLLERQGWPFDQWYLGTIVGACLLGAAGIAHVVGSIRHAREVRALAEELGLDYQDELTGTQLEEVPGLKSFRGRRWAGNGMTGSAGGQTLTVVDLTTTEGDGESSKSVNRTLALLPGAAAGLPDFDLAPRDFTSGLLEMIGFQGIAFDPEQAPEGTDREAVRRFNASYLLTRGLEVHMAEMKAGAADHDADNAVRRTFPAAVLGHFGSNPGWHVRVRGGDLIVWRGNGRFCKASERPDLMAGSLEIRRVLTESTGSPVGEAVVGGRPRPDPAQGMKRVGLASVGAFVGFFLGGMAGMVGTMAIFMMGVAHGGPNGPNFGWPMALMPVVFFGSAIGGLFLGGYVGWRLGRAKEAKAERADNS